MDDNDAESKLDKIRLIHEHMVGLYQHGAFINDDPYLLTEDLGEILYGEGWQPMEDKVV